VPSGEKQYKDYEKNPMLLYSLCLSIENGAKISIIFICGTFFPFFPQNGYRPQFMRQQSLLGGHNELTSVVQVAVHVVSTVHDVHGSGDGIDGHVGSFSLVMCSSLCASGVRLSSFRMCHFTFTLLS
jgi:hypothetical protein